MPIDLCTITGTVFDVEGNPAAGAEVWVSKVIASGVIIDTLQQRVAVSDAAGLVSFTVARNSTAWIFGSFYVGSTAFNVDNGIACAIPDSSTATLESLGAAVSGPTTGLTIKSNGVAAAGLFSTVDLSTDFTLDTSVAGVLGVDLAASLIVTTEQVQDALTTFFPDVAPYDWTYDDAGNAVGLVIAPATGAVNGLMSAADKTALDGVPATYQPLDSDLTAIAALAPTNDDIVQRKAGAWANRTPAQLKTDLVLVKGDVGLGDADNTADTAKPVSTAQQTALNLKANLISPSFTTPSLGAASATSLTVSGQITAQSATSLFAGITLNSGGALGWSTKGNLQSPSDGVFVFYNSAFNDFSRLQLGGTTAAFPALKRSGTVLQHRTASDSAYAEVDALEYRASGTKVIGAQGAAVADATDAASAITQLNLLLARLRAHGLIG